MRKMGTKQKKKWNLVVQNMIFVRNSDLNHINLDYKTGVLSK